jgi:ADP-heptose:LPS heptosyltransferase
MKILIVRLNAIGDSVMLNWTVTAMRRAMPEAELAWAAQTQCLPVIPTAELRIEALPFRREVYKKKLLSPALWMEQMRYYAGLRQRRFDWALDFQGNAKAALLTLLAGAKNRKAVAPRDAVLGRMSPHMPWWEGHQVEECFALASSIWDLELPERPVMPGFAAEREEARAFGPEVTIQTGAGYEDKRYPAAMWAEVGRRLAEQGLRVTALGAPGDPVPDGMESLIGQRSLAQSMALVAESRLHLSADTGTAHAAAAFGVPQVALFGRTEPERFRPYSNRAEVLRVSQSPADIPVESVVEAALRALGR